jgi:hypothetical protein
MSEFALNLGGWTAQYRALQQPLSDEFHRTHPSATAPAPTPRVDVCPRNHDMSQSDNVQWGTNSKGVPNRKCRACARRRAKDQYLRRSEGA